MLRAAIGVLVAALLVWPADPATAHWLDRLARVAGESGAAGKAGKAAAVGTLEHTALLVKRLPPGKGEGVLAAATTPEGHWRFVNRAGETLTVGTPDEMRRLASVLVPEVAGKAEARLGIYLTEDAAILHRWRLRELPAQADLYVVTAGEPMRLVLEGEGAALRAFAVARPGVHLELVEQRLFTEAAWQLARSFNRANVRVVAFEPGGAPALATVPRIDRAAGAAAVDAVDPGHVAGAFAHVRGQTVIVSGRVEGGILQVQPASGATQSVSLAALTRAAEAADVNLMVIAAATARQPGGRNWLWQRVEVAGLGQALGSATHADFLAALANGGNRLVVTAGLDHGGRAVLHALPGDVAAAPARSMLGEAWQGSIASIVGHVAVKSVHLYGASRDRQADLDLRIVPWIPATVQIYYLVALALGVFGSRVAGGWFRRIWPPGPMPPQVSRVSWYARGALRMAVLVLVFLPLVGVPASLVALMQSAWDMARNLVRIIVRLFGRKVSGVRPT